MKVLIFILVAVFFVSCSNDDTSVIEQQETIIGKLFGGEGNQQGLSIVVADDNAVVIAGNSEAISGESSVYLLKLDSSGQLIWEKRIEGEGSYVGNSIITISGGGYIVAGTKDLNGEKSVLVLHVDEEGDVIKEDLLRGGSYEWSSSVMEYNGDLFLLGGRRTSTGEEQFVIRRLTIHGDIVWQKILPGTDDNGGNRLYLDKERGKVVVVGAIQNNLSKSWDFCVHELSVNGELLNSKMYGGEADDWGHMALGTGSGYSLIGSTKSSGAGSYDIYQIRTDYALNVLSNKTYGGAGSDLALGFIKANNNGFVIYGGTTSSGAGNYDGYILKVDEEGNKIWDATEGGSSYEIFFTCIQVDGGYVCAGKRTIDGQDDLYVVKFNEAGVPVY